ncbi:outer membrane beta-barrel protein [Dyadobacter flavalbus]|nr:outer membrane beta-barrel protein [Dyadobacter flavalbus]
MAISASAQGVSKDSINMLNQQKEAIEISKKLNEKRIELAKLENELTEKTNKANEAAQEAQKAAGENEDLANRLRNDAQNKDLANQANKSAKQAEKSAKNARKAAEDVDDINKKIESLRKEIAEEESKSGIAPAMGVTSSSQASGTTYSGQANGSNQSGGMFQGNGSNQSAGYNQSGGSNQAPAYSNPAPAQQYPNNQQVIQRNVPVDGGNSNANANEIAQKVLESTYKNYPQQAGQPSIIINNIIVPSDYDKSRTAGGSGQQMQQYGNNNMDDYEAFKAWQNQRRGNAYSGQNNLPQNTEQTQYIQSRPGERLTFKERFGEVNARNSGMWVIPMVGVHASNFNADFKEGTADGRTGWNAGLDFRIHMKRFFIQPGAHYFSSSLRVTSEDSISSAPLLDGPRIHSLKVPVMIGLYLTKANKGFFKANIKGGIVGTYVLDVDDNNQAQFSKNNIEDYSYGLNAGLGLEFGFITLDFSHEWGMSPLFKQNDIKNNVLRATLGFKL